MPEKLHRNDEKLNLSEAITEAMEDWLLEEVESSRKGRNSELDKCDAGHIDTSKLESHHNRPTLWTQQFTRESKDDYMTARQIFCAQMNLSGLFRMQCQLLAHSQEDYEKRRFGDYPLGVNVSDQVNKQLYRYFGRLSGSIGLAQGTIQLETLATDTLELNDYQYIAINKIGAQEQQKKLGNFIRLQRLQRQWLDLSTDYILYAAYIRGGSLDTVPFLEPKSISDKPEIYLPFEY